MGVVGKGVRRATAREVAGAGGRAAERAAAARAAERRAAERAAAEREAAKTTQKPPKASSAPRRAPARASKPKSDLAVPAPAIVRSVAGSNRRALAAKPGYDPDKIFEQYPAVGPPVMKVDKTKGTSYLAKENTPEAKAVQKARVAAQRDIDAGNYTGVFNPEERYYANPENYPQAGLTIEEAIPRTEKTQLQYAADVDDAAKARLIEAYRTGEQFPGAHQWYAMGQLEKAYIDKYGPEAGQLAFKERFALPMAALTGGMSPKDNLVAAHYGNFMKHHGIDTPASADVPFPVGGRFLAGNLAQFDKIIREGQGLGTANPKRYNFAGNFMGHLDRSTIDEVMSGLIKPGATIPPGDSYGIWEKGVNDLGRSIGVANPAEFQDVAWSGGKYLADLARGKTFVPQPMIGTVNEALERTARLTGRDPEEILDLSFMPGNKPIYAKGGLVVKRRPKAR